MSSNSATSAVPLVSGQFLKHYFTTMRPYLLFVSGITGLAGLSFSGPLPLIPLLVFATGFFLSYGFGQALTDCFQMDTDALSSPYRPLVQGKISRSQVLGVSLIGLGIIALLITLVNAVNFALAVLAVAGLATYTWFKRRWWGGPFYNSWIVAVLFFIAFITGRELAGQQIILNAQIVRAAGVVFFGYANFVLAGYFKDIAADRATGYHTLPVVYGLTTSAVISDFFALAAVSLAVFSLSVQSSPAQLSDLLPWLVLLAGAIVSLMAQTGLHSVRDERQAYRPIALVVHAYILILGAIVLNKQPSWLLPLGAYYCAFVIVLKLRPMKEQV